MNAISKKVLKQRQANRISSEFYNSFESEEVIKVIRALCVENSSNIQIDDVMTVIENRDYYVRPEYKDQFTKEILSVPLSNTTLENATAIAFLNIAQTFFDKEYFEEQAKINSQPPQNKQRLKALLKRLSRVDIINYYLLIVKCKAANNMFIRNVDFIGMQAEIDEICYKFDSYIPEEDSEIMFDKIRDKGTMIDLLCKYINKHVIIAENVAEAFCKGGLEAAINYPEVVLSLQKTYPQAKILM